MADAIYAKTWAADSKDLIVSGCLRENSKPFAGYDNYIMENSTRDLVELLAKNLDYSLNSEVVAVRKTGKSVEIETREGLRFCGAKAIVCSPVTSLKDIEFSPSLPKKLHDTIDHLGIGIAVKGVIRFKKRFWPKQILCVFCVDSPCPQLWMEPERPSYKDSASCITCFIVGTPGEAMLEQPMWKVLQSCLYQLDLMFRTKDLKNPASSLYEDHSFCRWESVAYTYPKDGDPKVLSEPYFGGSLYFAGEHCGVDQSEIATINGALESGKHAAEQILNPKSRL